MNTIEIDVHSAGVRLTVEEAHAAIDAVDALDGILSVSAQCADNVLIFVTIQTPQSEDDMRSLVLSTLKSHMGENGDEA